MATRFAVKTGNWSDATAWDNGAVPIAGDTVYPNGYTVTIDTDINVASLNNNISPVTIQNIATPAMTSNTQPTGTVISSNNLGTAYVAFNQDGASSPYWTSGVNNTGWLGYTFSSGKVIKRYFFRYNSASNTPKTWTFEGSNDGFATAGVVLDTVASYVTASNYTSVLLANTTAYTSYRINVTATQVAGSNVFIAELEMTESTNASPVYGGTTGGSFTVPSTLSGTRNIVQSGAGIISNNSATVITTNHTSGNTVNFNIVSGGYIFNTLNDNASNELRVCSINGNGTVNFNGDIYGSQNTTNIYNQTGGTIYINANATVTINGNVYLAKGQSSIFYYTIHLATGVSNSAILNINGSVIGSSLYSYSAIYLNSSATINITGTLTSDISPCIITPITNVFSGGSGFINLTGTANLTNNNSQPCILTRNTVITINGAILNKNNKMAIWGVFIKMTANTNPYWVFQNTAGADITLAYGSATGSYPAESDVKLGVTYAASPTRTGTCAVPLPQYVSQGVATGSTVGTAYLNAADVWNIQTSTLTTAGSIGERLKNASTVQTNGDQLASYIV
jgi:hypothetical protein